MVATIPFRSRFAQALPTGAKIVAVHGSGLLDNPSIEFEGTDKSWTGRYFEIAKYPHEKREGFIGEFSLGGIRCALYEVRQ